MANTVDPDETAHYEPSHLDLQCLQIQLLLCLALHRLIVTFLAQLYALIFLCVKYDHLQSYDRFLLGIYICNKANKFSSSLIVVYKIKIICPCSMKRPR